MTSQQPEKSVADKALGDYASAMCATLRELAAQKVVGKSIMNYNGAMMAQNHAKDVANKLGLDPSSVAPFPQNISYSSESTKTPLWKSLLTSLALASGGAGAAVVGLEVLPSLLSSAEDTETVEPEIDPSTLGFKIE